MIRYISTRGGGAPQDFISVLMAGMAPDGGLYVPERWPSFDAAYLRRLAGLSYAELALNVMGPFIGDAIPPRVLRRIVTDTYEGGAFDHRAVAPLVQLGPQAWVMELYRGPTLSFKDYALQLVGRLFDHVLADSGKRITIVGATSGDTGSAAIAACSGSPHVDIFILHPRGRTSAIQRRQMTSHDAPNIHNIAIEGTFDDCQALVKSCFADQKLRADLNLSAVNSINWARIMAQVVYYFAAALALGAPDRAVRFAVPTGNFGNVYAGWVARRIGLPVEQLVIATNRNDILTRFFETGAMSVDQVYPSLSPSMDIQLSSNFERYLFDLLRRDAGAVRELMARFAREKRFAVDAAIITQARREFDAYRCDDDATLAMMRDCYAATGFIVDPHTAVGLQAASMAMGGDPAVPTVALACAHPAKFPEAVEKAIGRAAPVPERLAAVMEKKEHLTVMPHDLVQLKDHLRRTTRK